MKVIVIILLSYGCSHVQQRNSTDTDVSIESALNQAQMSYLKGCVDAFKTSNMSPSFPVCKERAKVHRIELNSIISQDPNE